MLLKATKIYETANANMNESLRSNVSCKIVAKDSFFGIKNPICVAQYSNSDNKKALWAVGNLPRKTSFYSYNIMQKRHNIVFAIMFFMNPDHKDLLNINGIS